MKKIMTGLAALALAAIAFAQPEAPEDAPSPNQVVEEAAAEEWVSIPAEELLVMRLAPDADGNPREVIIQLMPAPFSQGWVHNIKLLARDGWYDGISVNRVQDNYVVQWGDPNYDNPEADGEAKPLPDGLKVMGEEEYVSRTENLPDAVIDQDVGDPYAARIWHRGGWPLAGNGEGRWPVHCYGMVGVGRNYSPDTGSGAELYTVIGHAPRHLDRNIALVGRIIEGMEHLSSLPRGKGELGFYAEDEFEKRTPILSIDVAADLLESDEEPAGLTYAYEYLSTESEIFAKYADARANRRDPFFIHPAGGADICNIPVPVRPAPNG
ncbi:MAG: peptidylprolyl isomerase [Altererythrobacter sp.]|nr:peptidylprolyl isomerase [Altererythrobacter sp.]NNK46547.1 peptidylprolyl isomerase [Altererythrobacter sp.]